MDIRKRVAHEREENFGSEKSFYCYRDRSDTLYRAETMKMDSLTGLTDQDVPAFVAESKEST